MQADTINSIFAELSKHNPHPMTELKYTNNFTLLVAVMLSAQATDIAVNKATAELFAGYDTPEKMLSLGEEELKGYIKTIGLYNSKAANIIATCRSLITNHQSKVPGSLEALTSLPGVGRKTANVVLNCAFGQPTIAVDTHVFRVSKRLGMAKSSTPEAVEEELIRSISTQWRMHAHHWLILHGRYICKAKNPLCNECCVRNWCEFYQKAIG